jgi:hypothetical protein
MPTAETAAPAATQAKPTAPKAPAKPAPAAPAAAAPAPKAPAPKAPLPSAARCNRIYVTLTREPAFSNLLGAKTVGVQRRDEGVEQYPESVVEIAARLQAQDIDVNTCTRDEILAEAKAYFAERAAIAPESTPPVPPSVTMTADSDPAILGENACLAVYSLLLAAKSIGEHDRRAGAAGRIQTLKRAVEAYKPCVAVNPAPKNTPKAA